MLHTKSASTCNGLNILLRLLGEFKALHLKACPVDVILIDVLWHADISVNQGAGHLSPSALRISLCFHALLQGCFCFCACVEVKEKVKVRVLRCEV